MKKCFTFVLICALSTTFSFAQTKRYALLEHFTNTWCSTCATQNPSLFSSLRIETNTDLHHISYHWRTPYPNCSYYQINPAPQDARADFYGVLGSPRAVLNGAANTSLTYITPPIVEAAALTSPISIKVSETVGLTRTATIKVKSVGTVPTGTFKMYAALVEKKTNYNSPNGESVHYNVFRKFITSNNGDNITLSSAEQSFFIDYVPDFGILGDTYIVAWVQNTATKEVLNSGTKFDGLSPTNEAENAAQMSISPNPTTGKIQLTFEKRTPQYLTVFNTSGQVLENVKQFNSTSYDLDLARFPSGIYMLKIQFAEGVVIKRIVKN
jgi:Secretion system C-terminal sorting domain